MASIKILGTHLFSKLHSASLRMKKGHCSRLVIEAEMITFGWKLASVLNFLTPEKNI